MTDAIMYAGAYLVAVATFFRPMRAIAGEMTNLVAGMAKTIRRFFQRHRASSRDVERSSQWEEAVDRLALSHGFERAEGTDEYVNLTQSEEAQSAARAAARLRARAHQHPSDK